MKLPLLMIPMIVLSTNLFCAANDLHLSLDDIFSLTAPVEGGSFFKETKWNSFSSIALVQESDWRKRGARHLYKEVLDHIPGTVSFTHLFGGELFMIRGYVRELDAIRGMSTLIDGVPINQPSFGNTHNFIPYFSTALLNKVEVIKGPGSALHGNDAFHGVISLKTFEPEEEDFQEFGFSMGTKNYLESFYRFSEKLSDHTKLIGAFSKTHIGDQHIVEEGAHFSGGILNRSNRNDTASVLIKLIKEKSNWKSKFSFIHHNWQTDEGIGIKTSLVPFLQTSGSHVIYNILNYDYSKYLKNANEIQFNIYHWNLDWNDYFKQDGQVTSYVNLLEKQSGFKLNYLHPQESSKFNWAIGIESLYARIPKGFLSNWVKTDRNYLEDPARKVWSIVYQGIYKFTEKLRLLTGARVDKYKLFGTQKTPHLGLIYEANQSRILKFNYGNGFRSPVVAELAGGNFAAGNSSIKPEEIDSYEFTYARRFKRSTYSSTLFTSKWKNGIEHNLITFVNVGKKESKGIEFEYKHQLS
ncbi:TonB-dependent receptor, partial [bacterium]|nr:TonB-dependent receptor [bacterium]